MCKENSRLRKQFLSPRENPVRQALETRQVLGEIKRTGVTRGEGDKRYTKPSSLPSIIAQNSNQVDHGATQGLSDDDHPQYLLRSVATTKGDIFARSSSAISRLGVGSDGQVLTADSAQTLGIKWATPSSGAPTDAQYLTLATNGTLTVERVFTDGAGLVGTDGGAGSTYTLAVGAGNGITVNANDVALTTPGTLTGSTSNSSSGNHTHAVDAYDNPGTTANRLLKTGTGGLLTLEKLYVGDSGGDSNFDSGVDVQVIDASIGVSRNSQEATIDAYCYGSSIFASFRGRLAGGSRSSPSNVGADVEVARFGGAGYAGGFSGSSLAYMSVVKSQSGSSKGHRLEFWTTTNGGTNATLKATLANDGKFAVGGNHAPGATIDADGDIVTRNNGHLMADGGLRAGSTSSAQANCLILDGRSVAPSAESGALVVWYDDTAGVMKAKIPAGTVKTFTWT